MTITTADTAAIESLRTFAEQHGEIQFAHLCTAALNGEEWAIELVTDALNLISDREDEGTHSTLRATLEAIRATDTTRPDGAIARTAVEV